MTARKERVLGLAEMWPPHAETDRFRSGGPFRVAGGRRGNGGAGPTGAGRLRAILREAAVDATVPQP